jgi:hypothetical protein
MYPFTSCTHLLVTCLRTIAPALHATAQVLSPALSAVVRWHLPAVATLYMGVFISFIRSLQMRQSYG